MDLSSVGQVIATRRLTFVDDKTREVFVTIGKSQQFPDSSDYYCAYQITGIGDGKIKHAGGIDAVQALELAMKMIGADLFAFNRALGGKLRWEGDEKGDLGFPMPK